MDDSPSLLTKDEVIAVEKIKDTMTQMPSTAGTGQGFRIRPKRMPMAMANVTPCVMFEGFCWGSSQAWPVLWSWVQKFIPMWSTTT